MRDVFQLKRKVRIRTDAITNKEGNVKVESVSIQSEEQLASTYYNVIKNTRMAEEVSELQIHVYLVSNRKLGKCIIFIKRVIRKILEKILGWYYFPVVAQQTTFNKSSIEALKNLYDVIESQKSQIQELSRQIENIKNIQ